MNSPHVVAVYAAGEIHNTAYFVMEYVDGMDLSDRIKEKGLKDTATVCLYCFVSLKCSPFGLTRVFSNSK